MGGPYAQGVAGFDGHESVGWSCLTCGAFVKPGRWPKLHAAWHATQAQDSPAAQEDACPKCGQEMGLFETGTSNVLKSGWRGRGVYRCINPDCAGYEREFGPSGDKTRQARDSSDGV